MNVFFRPRLGQMLHKVIAIGTIYFILAAIEGCIRVRDDVGLLLYKHFILYHVIYSYDIIIVFI